MDVGNSISVRFREEGDALAAEEFEEPGRLSERAPGCDRAALPGQGDEVVPVERVQNRYQRAPHFFYPTPLAPSVLGFTV